MFAQRITFGKLSCWDLYIHFITRRQKNNLMMLNWNKFTLSFVLIESYCELRVENIRFCVLTGPSVCCCPGTLAFFTLAGGAAPRRRKAWLCFFLGQSTALLLWDYLLILPVRAKAGSATVFHSIMLCFLLDMGLAFFYLFLYKITVL